MPYNLKYKTFPDKGTILHFKLQRMQLSEDELKDLIQELYSIHQEIQSYKKHNFNQKEQLL